jgi:hypothetical protein
MPTSVCSADGQSFGAVPASEDASLAQIEMDGRQPQDSGASTEAVSVGGRLLSRSSGVGDLVPLQSRSQPVAEANAGASTDQPAADDRIYEELLAATEAAFARCERELAQPVADACDSDVGSLGEPPSSLEGVGLELSAASQLGVAGCDSFGSGSLGDPPSDGSLGDPPASDSLGDPPTDAECDLGADGFARARRRRRSEPAFRRDDIAEVTEEMSNQFSQAKDPIKCKARVWKQGRNGWQCDKMPRQGSEFCGVHSRPGGPPHGRVDEIMSLQLYRRMHEAWQRSELAVAGKARRGNHWYTRAITCGSALWRCERLTWTRAVDWRA